MRAAPAVPAFTASSPQFDTCALRLVTIPGCMRSRLVASPLFRLSVRRLPSSRVPTLRSRSVRTLLPVCVIRVPASMRVVPRSALLRSAWMPPMRGVRWILRGRFRAMGVRTRLAPERRDNELPPPLREPPLLPASAGVPRQMATASAAARVLPIPIWVFIFFPPAARVMRARVCRRYAGGIRGGV